MIKLVFSLGVIGVLANALVANKAPKAKPSTLQINDVFETKAVTYLLGSPDEVANAITDTANRQNWDPNLKEIQKISDDTFKLTYEGTNGNTYSETSKFTFLLDNSNFIIQEQVNND